MHLTTENNMASMIYQAVINHPDRVAIYTPTHKELNAPHTELTYAAFAEQVRDFQRALELYQLKEKDHVLIVALPQGSLFALITALLAKKLIPVFIDPRMGYRKIRQVLRETPLAAAIWGNKWRFWHYFLPELWKVPAYSVDTLEKRALETKLDAKTEQTASIKKEEFPFTLLPCHADDTAVITYTSGTTGLPKGADRTHGKMVKQFQILHELAPPLENDIGLTFLPTAVIHGLSLGMTSVIPALDLLRSHQFQPELICNQLKNLSVTCCGGSPFFIAALADYLEKNNLSLPSLRLIVIGSAGAHPQLLIQLSRILPNTEIVICYGASEAEPIAVVHGADIIAEYDQETIGRGYLVGEICAPLLVRIVQSTVLDDMLQNPDALIEIDHLNLPIDEIGEIVVSGPQVTDKYTNPLVSMEKKFYDSNGRLWHRTADRGCFDHKNKLWLTGRCGDQVIMNGKEIDPFALEIFIDSLPFIEKSAFVQSRNHKNAILYCRLTQEASLEQHASMIDSLTIHLKKQNITGVLIKIVQKIPVDNRHNSKINRQKLRLKNQFFHFFQQKRLSDESKTEIN